VGNPRVLGHLGRQRLFHQRRPRLLQEPVRPQQQGPSSSPSIYTKVRTGSRINASRAARPRIRPSLSLDVGAHLGDARVARPLRHGAQRHPAHDASRIVRDEPRKRVVPRVPLLSRRQLRLEGGLPSCDAFDVARSHGRPVGRLKSVKVRPSHNGEFICDPHAVGLPSALRRDHLVDPRCLSNPLPEAMRRGIFHKCPSRLYDTCGALQASGLTMVVQSRPR
jgi:hypothetical protein